MRTKLEDEWGNPVARPTKLTYPGFVKPGWYTIPIQEDSTGLEAETNPIVVAPDSKFGRYWADLHGQSEETIGTNSIDEYFRFGRDYGFLDACAHQGNDFQITDEFWNKIQATTRAYYRPRKFVTFPGWEWSGNTGLGGDRNVLFRTEGGPISRSSRALLRDDEAIDPCSDTVEQLFDRLQSDKRDSMLIAHVGGRYADLDRHREGLESAVEVHSAWGTFEWMLEDAFRCGYRVAIVANSDGHKGRPGASYPGASTFGSYGGLTCILATQLDRDGVWSAYQDRRVYATTGARIVLDVTAGENSQMGSVLPVSRTKTPTFHVRVIGTSAIERIELRNAMQVLKTIRPYASADLVGRVKLLWQGAEVRGRGRLVNWDGGLKVLGNRIQHFDTINFHNREKKCVSKNQTELAWQSTTTGGVAGVILDLEKPNAGQLRVSTTQKSCRVAVSKLGVKGRAFRCGGLEKVISAYRLPAAGGCHEVSFQFTPQSKQLNHGDNPIYACVVQEDGQMAWSSPIYLVK